MSETTRPTRDDSASAGNSSENLNRLEHSTTGAELNAKHNFTDDDLKTYLRFGIDGDLLAQNAVRVSDGGAGEFGIRGSGDNAGSSSSAAIR
jgi:hypothetical protein